DFIYGYLINEILGEKPPTPENIAEAEESVAGIVGAIDIIGTLDYIISNPQNFDYEQMTNVLNALIGAVAPDAEQPVIDSNLIEQAYVMYFYNTGLLTVDEYEFGFIQTVSIIKTLLETNPVFGEFAGGADVVGAIDMILKLYGGFAEYPDYKTPVGYAVMSDMLTEYLSYIDGGFDIDLNADILQQVYIRCFIDNDYAQFGSASKPDAVKLTEMIYYVESALNPDSAYYNAFLYDYIVSEFFDGDEAAAKDGLTRLSGIKEIVKDLEIINKDGDKSTFGYNGLAEKFALYLNLISPDDAMTDAELKEFSQIIEQLFVLYFYDGEILKPDEDESKLTFVQVLTFINSLIDIESVNYNGLISGFVDGGAEFSKYLDLTVKLGGEYKNEISYAEMFGLLSEYYGEISDGAEISDMLDLYGEELLRQIYILYLTREGILPSALAVPSAEMFDYIFSLMDAEDKNYNDLIYSIVEESLSVESALDMDELKAMKLLLDNLLSKMNDPKTYTEMSKLVGDLITDFGEFLPDVKWDLKDFADRFIEQVYIFNLLDKGLLPNEAILVTDLVEFVFAIRYDPVVAPFIDDATMSEFEEYAEVLKTASAMFDGIDYSRMVLTLDLPRAGDETFDFIEKLNNKIGEIWGDNTYIGGNSIVLKDIRDDFEHDVFIISLVSALAVFLIIALIYKSLMIPLILVLLIQAATWLSFAISPMFGSDIYFVSYIIVSCIQMGASIDYGILVFSRYRYYRQYMNKKDAVSCALKDSLKTILTSGFIIVIAGFVLWICSTSIAISSIGMFLFRGVIMSMLFMLTLLPAFLLLFDKAIEKTTVNSRFYKGGRSIENGGFVFFDENGRAVPLEEQTEEKYDGKWWSI
ncbi:MAG: MMPL family transporter, partial [Clostridiales bacterium]|nr:MMPL family transporter [Clostridiales bacterium]